MTVDGEENGGGSSNSSSSPPRSLDLYGKRRQIVKFQVLEREICLLQEEIKSIESLQPASRSCKELDNFVVAKQDPLLATNQETQKSHFLKRLWRRCCFCHPWSRESPNSRCFKKTKCCTCLVLPSLNCCTCRYVNSGFCKSTKENLCCICVKPCYCPCCR